MGDDVANEVVSMNVRRILIIVVLLLAVLSGCSKPYVYDCVIGNFSFRQEAWEGHPELSEEELEMAWDMSQKMFLYKYYEQGLCDEVILGRART